jgi:hypothetical protein
LVQQHCLALLHTNNGSPSRAQQISWKVCYKFEKYNQSEEMNMTFEELKADIGIFEYYNTGFIVHFENNAINIEWSSIKALFGYKVDLYTVDVICLDIFYEDEKQIRITEETKGWYIFLEKLQTQFPQIKKNWDVEIAFPAFETNLTLLYESENNNLEESIKLYYGTILVQK